MQQDGLRYVGLEPWKTGYAWYPKRHLQATRPMVSCAWYETTRTTTNRCKVPPRPSGESHPCYPCGNCGTVPRMILKLHVILEAWAISDISGNKNLEISYYIVTPRKPLPKRTLWYLKTSDGHSPAIKSYRLKFAFVRPGTILAASVIHFFISRAQQGRLVWRCKSVRMSRGLSGGEDVSWKYSRFSLSYVGNGLSFN